MTIIPVLVAAGLLAANPVQIGPDTTVVDGPVREDGTIDYIAAINAAAGEGVHTENNAFVGLLEVMPIDGWDEAYVDGLYAALDLPRPADDAERFVRWDRYPQQHGLEPEAAHGETSDSPYGAPLERPWTRDEFPEVAAWLESNQAALDALVQAFQRPRYYAPLVSVEEPPMVLAAPLPYLGQQRTLARALVNRLYLQLGEGNLDGALTDVTALLNMGARLRNDSTLIGTLVAISIHALMREPLLAVLADPRLNAEQAMTLNRRFADQRPSPRMAELAGTTERYSMLDIMQDLDRLLVAAPHIIDDPQIKKGLAELAHAQVFDVSRLMRRVNGYFDETAQRLATEDYRQIDEIDASIQAIGDHKHTVPPDNINAIKYNDYVTDYLTDLLAGLMMPALGAARRAEMQTAMYYDLHHLAVALAAYQRRHGRYPDSLDALTPHFIDAVPRDFATGDPLYYERRDNGYLLYSVGGDGEDDGGVDDLSDGDYVVSQPPAKPRP